MFCKIEFMLAIHIFLFFMCFNFETFHKSNSCLDDGVKGFSIEREYVFNKKKVKKISNSDEYDIKKYIKSKNSKFPYKIIYGICSQESSFRKNLSNKKSTAKGCMQVIYPTGKWIHEDILKLKEPYNHKRHNTDYKYNIDIAIALLEHYYKYTNYNIDKTMLYYRGCNDTIYFKNVIKYSNKKDIDKILKKI